MQFKLRALANSSLEEENKEYKPMEIDNSSPQLSEENNREVNRLIIQYLSDQGHHEIARELESKTGVKMEEEQVEDFKTKILNGDFNEAAACVQRVVGQEQTENEIHFLIQQQNFLELLCEKNQTMKAVVILQKELTPKAKTPSMAHNLAKLLTCKSEEEIKQKLASWAGAGLPGRRQVLEQVQLLLPENSMLQPKRLEVLLRQSLEFQALNCSYHNKFTPSFSLLSNHICQKIQTPFKELCKIKKHKDEVWLVKFSNCGNFFATVGADKIVFVWELKEKENGFKVFLKTTFKGNEEDVNFISWTNQSEKWIITGGKSAKNLIVWKTNNGDKIVTFNKHQDQVQQAQFLYDDERVISCSNNRQIILWKVTTEESGIHSFQEITTLESKNSLDLAIAFQKLVLVGTGGTIILADFRQDQNENCLSMNSKFFEYKKISCGEAVNSIAVTPDGKQFLVNISVKSPKMLLFDIETGTKLAEYEGHKQPNMVLKASFSKDPSPLVSIGSEDQIIRIWHKERGELLRELKGHSLAVNAVAFSPKQENLMVSVSDDMTVRIWGLEGQKVEVAKQAQEIIQEEGSEEAKESNQERQLSFNDYGSEDSEEDEEDISDMDLF